MFYIQQIYVEWTDNPEFAHLAARRMATPLADRIPYLEPDANFVIQTIRLRESDRFEPTKFIRELPEHGSITTGAVLISRTGPLTLVDFVWSKDLVGLPKRETVTGFRLQAKEWGRVRYNGWHEDPKRPGGKAFRETILNILPGMRPPKNFFLETEPLHVLDMSRDLEADIARFDSADESA